MTFMGAVGGIIAKMNKNKRYYAAPYEMMANISGKNWGVIIGCAYPPIWKFWADVEFSIVFIVSNTGLQTGDVSVTVFSKTYDAEADILEPDEEIPYALHRTVVVDTDSVDSILDDIGKRDNIRWKYPDSSHTYGLGTLTLPGVLPHVLRKCGVAR